MQPTTHFPFMNEALQFLGQELEYAKLKPNSTTHSSHDNASHSNAIKTLIPMGKPSIDTVAADTKPTAMATQPSTHREKTDATPTNPEPTFPSDQEAHDLKEYYKSGCIMAMILEEEKPRKPADEIITTTKDPWKWGEEEKAHAERVAVLVKNKSIAGCEGLAASRWFNAEAEKEEPQKPVRAQPARRQRRACKGRNAAAACEELVTSRWYNA